MAEFRYLHDITSGGFRWSYDWASASDIDPNPANMLWAGPVFAGRGGTVSVLLLNRRSGGQAATHLRVGIYGVSGPDKPAPTTLLMEVNTQIATDIACNDFLFTLTTSFLPGGLYWIATLTDATNLTLRQGVPYPPLFGLNATLNSYQACLTASYAYGSLPATFPSSVTATRMGPWFGVQFTT